MSAVTVSSRQFEVKIQDRLTGNEITVRVGAIVDYEKDLRGGEELSQKAVGEVPRSNRRRNLDWTTRDGFVLPPDRDLLGSRVAAFRGLVRLFLLSSAVRLVEVTPFASRRLPGSGDCTAIAASLQGVGWSSREASACLDRYGYLARHFVENPQWREVLVGGVRAGAAYIARYLERSVSLRGFAKSLAIETDHAAQIAAACGFSLVGTAAPPKNVQASS